VAKGKQAGEDSAPGLARLPPGRHGLSREFVTRNQRDRLTAGMIAATGDIEVTNPDLLICHLDEGATLNMELTADIGKGYDSKSGDLGGFILKSAPKFGVRILTTSGLPAIPAKWRYKETSNEFHLLVEGNFFPQLHAFLTKTVGLPPGPPTTNSSTKLRSIEAYYGTNLGAVVSCHWELAHGGKQYTSFVIVSYGQPTSDQVARSFNALIQESEKGNERFRALDGVRSSAPYVSEFIHLFPETEVNYRYFTGTDEPGFDLGVDLYGRYELGMQLPVLFDSSRRSVIGFGEPKFYLSEAASQKGRETSYNPAGDRKFGPAEWRKIVESEGDFRAIGYAMKTNQPVVGFKDRRSAK